MEINNKTILVLVMVGLIGLVASGVLNKSASAVIIYDGEITLYKSPGCGCCGLYSGYLDNSGELNVVVENMDDVTPIKEKYNIPAKLRSCHTTIIGDYFVEGHIPTEAIVKLLEEKPDIAGIAMEGMPSGSPGMPGGKLGDFVIYAVNHDGTYDEFMRL